MPENKKSYYAIIPADVRYDEKLTPNAKLLYGEITALCNEKGYCWASNSYFANLYNVCNKSISLWIKSLIDSKYISSEIVYKEGTKEIAYRYIRILPYPMEKNVGGYGKNLPYPMEKKVKDNNTINNTVNNTVNKDISSCSNKLEPIISAWNSLDLQQVKSINPSTKRYSLVRARIKEHGEEEVINTIKSISKSKFLKGQNAKGWTITFDWLVKPNNFVKVQEGNYIDKEASNGSTKRDYETHESSQYDGIGLDINDLC